MNKNSRCELKNLEMGYKIRFINTTKYLSYRYSETFFFPFFDFQVNVNNIDAFCKEAGFSHDRGH